MMHPDSIRREDWRSHLASLPSVEPPEALWARIAAGRQTRAPARKLLRPWVGAAVAASLFAVWLWPRLDAGPVTTPAAPAASGVAVAVSVDRGLKQVDDELALAYARNAGESELAALWQVRERLIAERGTSPDALLARL